MDLHADGRIWLEPEPEPTRKTSWQAIATVQSIVGDRDEGFRLRAGAPRRSRGERNRGRRPSGRHGAWRGEPGRLAHRAAYCDAQEDHRHDRLGSARPLTSGFLFARPTSADGLCDGDAERFETVLHGDADPEFDPQPVGVPSHEFSAKQFEAVHLGLGAAVSMGAAPERPTEMREGAGLLP